MPWRLLDIDQWSKMRGRERESECDFESILVLGDDSCLDAQEIDIQKGFLRLASRMLGIHMV